MTLTIGTAGESSLVTGPVDLAVILDNTGGMNRLRRLDTAREILSDLLARLDRDTDRVALVTTYGRAEVVRGLTPDFAAVREAARPLAAVGLASLDDALDAACHELGRSGRLGVRKVVLVLSTGEPGYRSTRDFSDQMRRSGIAVVTVGLSAIGDGARILSSLAERHGGRHFEFSNRAEGANLHRAVIERLDDLVTHDAVFTEVLAPELANASGFSIRPDTDRRAVDGTRTLGWTLPRVAIGDAVVISYSIKWTGLRAGTEYFGRSALTYASRSGGRRLVRPLTAGVRHAVIETR